MNKEPIDTPKTKEEIIREYEHWDNVPEETDKIMIYFDENEFGLENLEITFDK